MGAFEGYREIAKSGELANQADWEQAKIGFLQLEWAEMKCADITDVTEREAAQVDWMTELGDWFRTNILEHVSESGQLSRKEYFFELYEKNHEQAIKELDAFFMRLRH
jgi:hypothetical protein